MYFALQTSFVSLSIKDSLHLLPFPTTDDNIAGKRHGPESFLSNLIFQSVHHHGKHEGA